MKRPAVTSKVGQLNEVLSELLALYHPANAAAFVRNEAKLSTALTKHQLLCTAMRCDTRTTKANRASAETPARL